MARKNPPKRTPEVRAKFLSGLEQGLTVTGAATLAGTTKQTAYRWRTADKDFADAWDAAIDSGTDTLEDEARRRGVEGVKKLVLHCGEPVLVADSYDAQGKPIGALKPLYEHRYSDTMLAMLLNGRRPEKFKYRHEHTGENGGPIVTEDPTLLEAARRIAFVLSKGAGSVGK